MGSPGEPRARRQPKEKPAKPWARAEAGRYRSSDERFLLESGGGQWFLTDAETLDELGLPRTTGPFSTLDAAKAAAEDARGRAAATSPLADRIREAATRPAHERTAARGQSGGDHPGRTPSGRGAKGPSPDAPAPTPAPATFPSSARAAPGPEAPTPSTAPAPARTWLDDLADRDPEAARRSAKLVRDLRREDIADADALVRREVLGGTPSVATRLLARDLLGAIARLRDPSAGDILEAVLGVVAASPRRAGLPGWALVERDRVGGASDDTPRTLRVSAADLAGAARPDED